MTSEGSTRVAVVVDAASEIDATLARVHAESVLVEYDEAMAVYLSLDDLRGVAIKLQSGADVSMPEFRETCLERLES